MLAFLLLSLAPAILIFLIASNFINRSIEGWFKPQVERPLDQALAVAQTYYRNLERTALRHAPADRARRSTATGCWPTTAARRWPPTSSSSRTQLGLGAITVFGAARPGAGPRQGPDPRRPAHPRAQREPAASAGSGRPGGHHRARADRRRPRRGGDADLVDARRRAPASWAWWWWARHVPERLEAQGARHLAGVPGVQAAQAAEEPDQGHLHPALPADDADRRVLVHVVRASTWPAASPAPSSSSRRARARWPPATSPTRSRRAPTTRSASWSTRSTA